MIRNYKKEDLNKIMELWFHTNIAAHSFIPQTYWEKNFDFVKNTMPSATIYVYEGENGIQGFIGLIDEYIAGIFIDSQVQSKGIGKMLLDYVKETKNNLSLHVYKENNRAVTFYAREGFVISETQIDKNTGKDEYHMVWKQDI